MNSLRDYIKSVLLQRYRYLCDLSVYEYFRLLSLIFLGTGFMLLLSDFDTQIHHGKWVYGKFIDLNVLMDWLHYVLLGTGFIFASRFLKWSDKFYKK